MRHILNAFWGGGAAQEAYCEFISGELGFGFAAYCSGDSPSPSPRCVLCFFFFILSFYRIVSFVLVGVAMNLVAHRHGDSCSR